MYDVTELDIFITASKVTLWDTGIICLRWIATKHNILFMYNLIFWIEDT